MSHGGTTVGEFFLDLIVDASKGELTITDLVKSMGELEVASVGEIAILATLAQKLAVISEHAIATTLGIEHITSSTGMSTKALQQWSYAAEYVGISAETMHDTLSQVSHDLAMGKFSGDYGGLKNLGVILEHTGLLLINFDPEHPEELIKAIRKSSWFQHQKPEIQFTLLHGTELQAILDIMQEKRISEKELTNALNNAPIFSDQELKNLDQMHKSWTEIKQVSEQVGMSTAEWARKGTVGFFHDVLDGLKVVNDFLAQHFFGGSGDKVFDDALLEIGKTTPSDMEDVAKGMLSVKETNAGETAIGPAPVWAGGLLPEAQPRVTNIKNAPVVNINGSKLSGPEVEVHVGKALDKHVQKLASQIFSTESK